LIGNSFTDTNPKNIAKRIDYAISALDIECDLFKIKILKNALTDEQKVVAERMKNIKNYT
jgi:hypothetical protein